MNDAPFDRLSTLTSTLIVDGVCGAVLGALISWMIVVAVREARRAHDALGGVAERPRPGVHTLRGVARLSPGEEAPPVEVVIEQIGEQRTSKHGQFVYWRESARAVRARPFYLELSSRERVRVEPDTERLDYVDDLDVTEREPGANVRRRRASVVEGEAVYVRGLLGRGTDPHAEGKGYRDAGATALILRPSGEGMMISSHPVDRRHRRRSNHALLMTVLSAAVFVGLHAGPYGAFHALRGRSAVRVGVVTGRGSYTTRHKNSVRRHYTLAARLDDGVAVQDEVSALLWRRARVGDSVPFTVARSGRVAQIGVGQVGVSRGAGVAGVAVSLGLIALYAVGASARRAWFERRVLVEQEPGTL